MKPRVKYLLWSFITLLACGGGTLWFLANFEQVEAPFFTRPGDEALLNPYLAAERFLNKNNIKTQSVSGAKLLDELPLHSDTIFLSNHRNDGLLTTARQDALYDWIIEGGHLVMVAHTLWDEEQNGSGDPFLDSLDIRRFKHDFSNDELEEIEPVETRFAGRGETLTLAFNPVYYLLNQDKTADSGIKSHKGYHLLQYDINGGRLTVLSDDQIWRNNNIGENDHALLFHNLIASNIDSETPSKLWIVHDLEFPSLLELIWKKAHYAVLILFLLLVFSLWAAYNRFGPPLVDNHRIRRSLLEHLDACGRYHWRHDQGNTLLTTLREQLQQQLEQHHPSWHQLALEEQYAWLNRRSSLPQQVLAAALDHQPQSEHEFTSIVQTLNRLRKTL